MITSSTSHRLRKLQGRLMEGVCLLAALAAVIPLVAFLWHLVSKGASVFSADLFIRLPLPPGETGGGLRNSIIGSLAVVGMATVAGIPLGVGSALFMTEFARPRVASALRFACDVLSGIPSIVMGLLAYEVVVVPMHHFSALSGAVALAFIMLPVVVITTQEMLHLVPQSLREAGHALGIPAWRIAASISLRAAAPGVLTGMILAVSPHRRRDRADAVHRLRQSVPQHQPQGPHRHPAPHHLHLRHQPLRRLAPPCLGRRAGPGPGHPGRHPPQPLRALVAPAQPEFLTGTPC